MYVPLLYQKVKLKKLKNVHYSLTRVHILLSPADDLAVPVDQRNIDNPKDYIDIEYTTY